MIPARGWLVLIFAAIVLMAVCVKARASIPQLPAGVTCEVVRSLVAEHGKVYAYAWARLHGYSKADIEAAKRCLR